MPIRLVRASPAHVCRIANNLRGIDRLECEAMGRSPKEALRLGLNTSEGPLTVMDVEERRPIAMFGVMPLSLVTGTGVPWFLGTDEVYRYPRDLMVTGRAVIEYWLEHYRLLQNVVAIENTRAIKLLLRWGAHITEEPRYHLGVEFIPFEFRRFKESDGEPSPA